jgi:hypothetical protein
MTKMKVTRSSSNSRPMEEHPAGYDPLLAHRNGEAIVAFRRFSTLGIRDA